ncbi:DegT/DnrJ/EryC1/StrS family aminotransferase [Candidatus Villigracilis saccharophilus]|uniref:DegT/DnrJ/EryC1/StrS family aminotransferase n=1 Tax=Candidatus Villigracilis saccharophilus TaxID=3140684 RepID=UPI003135C5F7|nr:DegT/DnrJ/EryC1/StrS family aminotransferase [Anaerolineales bacterium]
MISLVDLTAQYHSIKEEIDSAVLSTLESGHFILGPQVVKFEESIAVYLGVKHAIGLASGTDALVLALRALNIGTGDEVIIPAYTFFATAGTVMSVGAQPVFVDVDPQSYQIDVSKIRSAITPKTKAIIPVHLYGHPAEMNPILEIARENNLKVIEDNAQGLGAEYLGKKTGSFGDIACLSFFPTKNLGAFGDAGMVVTNDPLLAERMRMLRTHGWKKKYYSEEVGYNSRLDALQAAILQAKFPHLDSWNEKRRELAQRYNEKLGSSGIVIPVEREWGKHVYHLYIVRSEKRDALQAFLKQKGIASEVYYPLPPHLATPCRKLGYKEGDFPHAEKASRETFALPLYPELPLSQQDEVVDTVKEFFEK